METNYIEEILNRIIHQIVNIVSSTIILYLLTLLKSPGYHLSPLQTDSGLSNGTYPLHSVLARVHNSFSINRLLVLANATTILNLKNVTL